ncbi:MAG: hypothetical protein II838_01010 [Lachnospiraceae bacterium]|nr:hypothetical protein [Lachnospiraceae bacterium]
MKLAELANINTGLVTARKQAKRTDQEIIKYRTLNLKAICEKGYIDDKLVEEFEANERIKPVYLTKVGDVVVRLTFPFTAVLIDGEHENLIIPSHFVVIRVEKEKLLPEYLYWLLNTERVKQELQQNINSTTIGTVKPMSYAELNIEQITLQEQAQVGELYMLAKKELYLLDQIMGQKELYYKEAINRIQKEMRKK